MPWIPFTLTVLLASALQAPQADPAAEFRQIERNLAEWKSR